MSNHVHHLNCATMCLAAAKVPGLAPERLVAHVLLVEGANGLTLVDSGLGTSDIRGGASRLGMFFVHGFGPRLALEETALQQVRARGYEPSDVTDIVLTHLDVDHAGGIGDFPNARIHVHATELSAALHPSLREKLRYVQSQWAHGPLWVEHAPNGDDWFGFSSVRAVGDDILLIPLHGHTGGHSGVAVRQANGHWLLHAGDAYFHSGDMDEPRRCPPFLRAFQSFIQVDARARKYNLARLQSLRAEKSAQVTVFCAHDQGEFDALTAATD